MQEPVVLFYNLSTDRREFKYIPNIYVNVSFRGFPQNFSYTKLQNTLCFFVGFESFLQ